MSVEANGWDRTFLDISSKMAEPICSVWHLLCFRLVAPLDPQKFENCSHIAAEIAMRTLIGLGAGLGAFLPFVAPTPMICSVAVLAVGSKIMRAIGFAFQKGGYTYVRGIASEKALNPHDQVKVMTWNICGIAGGLTLDHGGVIQWRSRLNAIIEKIKTQDADVLILQEVYDTALAEAIIEQLQPYYTHFFMHLGPNILGSEGGCMLLSKCAVHKFTHTSFENNEWTLNRGFAVLELKTTPQDLLPSLRVIGTHLIHGDDPLDKKNRMEQVSQMVSHLEQESIALPTVLAGDLNIERDLEEGKILSSRLHHGYRGSQPTCTNRLVAQWDSQARSVWGETIDYISLFKSRSPEGTRFPVIDEHVTIEDCHLVEAFDESYNTQTALSDHHGLVAVIKGLH